ncbi:hypothetical protein HRR77_009606 [Exophiala dermatitidis]|nr:hypothetical protein HRR77_009606 [Exophiala dermatitidis]KAJ4586699.1 hypothetical protein HRR82_009597 [Exophiala dermatitidis]
MLMSAATVMSVAVDPLSSICHSCAGPSRLTSRTLLFDPRVVYRQTSHQSDDGYYYTATMVDAARMARESHRLTTHMLSSLLLCPASARLSQTLRFRDHNQYRKSEVMRHSEYSPYRTCFACAYLDHGSCSAARC